MKPNSEPTPGSDGHSTETPGTLGSGTPPQNQSAELSARAGRFASQDFPWRDPLFGILILYFAGHIILRVLVSPSVDLDEAQQLVLSQRLAWGYGPQPPLYTWIQVGFFTLFGPCVFALALFKNLLLLGLYAFTYANAKRISGQRLCAVAAMLSLFFFPHIAWESQRDLTHSVLASTMAAATLYCWLRVLREPCAFWYVLLGLSLGTGLLSKYNFILWMAGLFLAIISMPKFRPAVLNKGMVLSLAVCALVVLPHALWILGHRHLAFASANKLRIQESMPWINAIAAGMGDLFLGLGSFLGPLVALGILLLLTSTNQSTAPRPGRAYENMLWRTWIIVVVMLVLLVACTRTTVIRERWLQPILVSIPVAAMSALGSRLSAKQVKWMSVGGGLIMLIVTVGIPARVVFAEPLNFDEPLNIPYHALADQVRPILPESTLIMAETSLLAGNLCLAFPERTVATPEVINLFPNPHQHTLLVWDARHRELPRDAMRQWAAAFTPPDLSRLQPQYFTAPYNFFTNRQMRMGIAFIK